MERGIFGSPPDFFFHLWHLDLDLEIFVLGLDLEIFVLDIDLDHGIFDLDLEIFVLDLDHDHEFFDLDIFALDLVILEDVVSSADPLLCISAYSKGF